MNTTLPPSRDLPPGRHAEIRAAVLEAVTPAAGRRWVAPLVTAAAALVAVGLVAFVVPWHGGTTAAVQPPRLTSPTAPPPAPVDGVTPEEASAIERGCVQSAGLHGTFTLRQVLTDEAGRLALVQDPTHVLACELDGPALPYNAAFGGYDGAAEPVSIDYAGSSAGGDAPGGKEVYAGQHGSDVVVGRVAPEVARVVYVQDGTEVEAKVGNGTYLARIVRPTDWVIPQNRFGGPVVRAYDKNGTLLGQIGS
jgi:hypothetical protein